MNSRFENALRRRPQATPPIWFMRQAGRYHKHYQALRARHSFEQLCRQPELAAEVAMGPIEDFDFDVAILFSDILFPLDALGLELSYSDKGPHLAKKVREASDLAAMPDPLKAVEALAFQSEAMKLTRARLPSEKSLIGFVGGLWTLFVYAIEGSHSGGLVESKKRIGLWPDFVRIMGPLLRENIRRQLNAGAEVVMIFDTAAGEVAPGFYRRWMEAPLLEFAREFPGKIGYYSKGTREEFFSPEFLSAPWAGMGVDHRWTLASGLRMVRSGFVQGNFDQGLLHLPADGFRRELDAYFEPIARLSAEERAGWVCGLGHGVLPATPEENVRTFVRTAREVFR